MAPSPMKKQNCKPPTHLSIYLLRDNPGGWWNPAKGQTSNGKEDQTKKTPPTPACARRERDLLEGERRRPLIRPVDVRHHLVVPGREVAHVSVQLSHRHERVLGEGLRGRRAKE